MRKKNGIRDKTVQLWCFGIGARSVRNIRLASDNKATITCFRLQQKKRIIKKTCFFSKLLLPTNQRFFRLSFRTKQTNGILNGKQVAGLNSCIDLHSVEGSYYVLDYLVLFFFVMLQSSPTIQQKKKY